MTEAADRDAFPTDWCASVVRIDGADRHGAAAGRFPGVFIDRIYLTAAAATAGVFAEIGKSGPNDGFVDVAGGFRWETIANGAAASWDFLFRINVMTALNTSCAGSEGSRRARQRSASPDHRRARQPRRDGRSGRADMRVTRRIGLPGAHVWLSGRT